MHRAVAGWLVFALVGYIRGLSPKLKLTLQVVIGVLVELARRFWTRR
jgi:hypothetical protein